jgi:hypothetical protein
MRGLIKSCPQLREKRERIADVNEPAAAAEEEAICAKERIDKVFVAVVSVAATALSLFLSLFLSLSLSLSL